MNHPSKTTVLITLAIATGYTIAIANDWPHMMGINYDRKSAENVPTNWSSGKPELMWEIELDGGFGSFVTGEGKAFIVIPTRGNPGSGPQTLETVVGLDRTTGEKLWETPLGPAEYDGGAERGAEGNDGGDGPRATPTYADGRVFVLGGKFDLNALDASTGEVLWKQDLMADFGAPSIRWSNTAAPLVVGSRVIVSGGGDGQCYLAFNAEDGDLLWSSGTDLVSHASPVLTTIHGKEQVLFMVQRGIVSIDPINGSELWNYPFAFRVSVGASPVVWEDIVHCTAGYGTGGGACRVTLEDGEWKVEELWRSRGNRDTASHWMTAVSHDGYVYGTYGFAEFGSASFKCIDIRTGDVAWEEPGFGHGQTTMASGHLFAMTDFGRLSVIDPTPEGFREISRTDLIDGKCWAVPVITNGQLFIRSTTRGVCLEL